MEIIKPGKIRKIKLKCGECGCEFTCNLGELTRIYGTLWAECPQEGCHNVVEVPNGTPEYIAPEKQRHAVGAVVVDLPVGDSGALFPIYPTDMQTLRTGVIHNGYKETYRHRKSKG